MKKITLIILSLICSFSLQAQTNWYASSTGSDGNTGTSTGSPFLTLSKIQSVYHAGDIIHLNGGNTFAGTLSVSGGSVVSYGSGRATISGLKSITGWVNIGTNLWRAHDASLGTNVRVLLINGSQVQPGRFPKTGYTTYTNPVSNTSIKATGLIGTWSGSPNIVIRKSHFNLSTYHITSIDGTGVVTYTGGSGDIPLTGYGCFIQNTPEACTQAGDWAYDGSGNITMYSVGSPTNVQASYIDNLITISANSTTIDGINFTGANLNCINSNNRTGLTVQNFGITFAGATGLFLNNNTGALIKNGTIDQTNGNAIELATSTNNTIDGVTATNIAMIAGLSDEYSGIRVIPIGARNTTVTNCSVSNTGYNGYFIEGSFTASNLIGHDCLKLLDDGGCFYTGVGHSVVVQPASTLSNSIFYNAIGAPVGTSDNANQAVCVYFDDNSNHITTTNVTGYNAGQYDFFSHNNQNVTWSGCLGYSAGSSIMALVHDGLGAKLSGISLVNNQFIGASSSQFIIVLRSIGTDGIPSDLQTWGTSVNSYYGSITATSTPFQTQLFSQSAVNRTFSSWQSITAQDASSSYVTIPSPIAFYPNPSASVLPVSLANTYKDLPGNSYGPGTLNVPAYGSYFLYFFAAPPSPPIISYHTPNTYTVGNSISLSPTSTGGPITSYSIDISPPTGTTFNSVTGALSGTATTPQALTTYNITANGPGGSGHASLQITINAVPIIPPNISYTTPHVYVVGTGITPLIPTNTGGVVVTYSGSVPPGFTLNTSTGVISGTPTTQSVATNYTIHAVNSGGFSNFTINITINPKPPAISYSPAFMNATYGYNSPGMFVNNTGGPATGWSITPTLPAGLNFNSGNITGTPTVISSATVYTITASNVGGSNNTNVTITVNKAPLTLTATNKEKTQGSPNPALTYTISGLRNGDTGITTPPTLSTTAVTDSPAGVYPITISGGASSKYTLSYRNGVLSVYTAIVLYGIKFGGIH